MSCLPVNCWHWNIFGNNIPVHTLLCTHYGQCYLCIRYGPELRFIRPCMQSGAYRTHTLPPEIINPHWCDLHASNIYNLQQLTGWFSVGLILICLYNIAISPLICNSIYKNQTESFCNSMQHLQFHTLINNLIILIFTYCPLLSSANYYSFNW